MYERKDKTMFRKRLEEALAMRNMTAAELSRKSGVSEGMISTRKTPLNKGISFI